MLRRLGATADSAGDGNEAIARIERTAYDLVLMDCHMPEMDGFEATRRVRELQSERAHVPIVALTASATAEDRERCLAAGMDDFLAKPVDRNELAKVLRSWLSSGHPAAPTEPASDAPDAAPPELDEERLALLATDLGPDMVKELSLVFEQDTLASVERIIRHHAAAEHVERGRAAHALKGACLNLGATRLAALARQLESADGDELDALVERLPREYTSTIEALHNRIGALSSGPSARAV